MVSAQQPLSTHSMGYTTVDDNTLYILGGAHYPDSISQSNFTYQFVSLDLTSNWDTTNPPWKTLPYPSNYLSDLDINRYSLLASPDSRKFSLLKITETNFVYDYNVDSGSWTQAMALSRYTLAGRGLRAVIDPSTGLVYIPGAGLSLDNSEMVIIDPSTGSTSPSFRIRSCMVSAYNGSKIVLFGGDMNGPSVAAISVFDVASSTWSDGPSASDARSGMACSVSGDNFIVWGGEKFTSAVEVFGVPSAPLIYNIRTNQWTTQFMAAVNPGHPGPTGPGGGGSGGSGNGDAKSNGAAIGGGIAGAVLPLQSNNPQYDPMAAWSPTHTYVPVSMIPPRPYSTVNPSSPQDYNQQLDHQPDHIQEQHSPHNNPQYDPTGTQTLLSPAVRAPHATTVPESGASDQELLEKINSLQGEWIRRQAKQQR
ncbi:hypothetical protein BG000_002394 [Podila horticola]|nr:hypothetical protein BG000_002394 [Podila horticola]